MIYKPSQGIISAGHFRTHPRYRGCVGHWLMGEGAGVTAYDVSGRNNHGTFTAGPIWRQGQFGAAVSFDGVDDYINIPDPGIAEGLSALSVCAWAQSDVTITNNGRGLVSQTIGGTDTFNLFLHQNDNMAFEINTGVAVRSNATLDLADTAWHHYVGVYNGANVFLYVDGVVQVSQPAQTGVTNATAAPVTLGGYDAARMWQGRIDDVRIYNRALSGQEVWSLYNDPFLEFRRPQRRAYFIQAAGPTIVLPHIVVRLQAVTRAATW